MAEEKKKFNWGKAIGSTAIGIGTGVLLGKALKGKGKIKRSVDKVKKTKKDYKNAGYKVKEKKYDLKNSFGADETSTGVSKTIKNMNTKDKAIKAKQSVSDKMASKIKNNKKRIKSNTKDIQEKTDKLNRWGEKASKGYGTDLKTQVRRNDKTVDVDTFHSRQAARSKNSVMKKQNKALIHKRNQTNNEISKMRNKPVKQEYASHRSEAFAELQSARSQKSAARKKYNSAKQDLKKTIKKTIFGR